PRGRLETRPRPRYRWACYRKPHTRGWPSLPRVWCSPEEWGPARAEAPPPENWLALRAAARPAPREAAPRINLEPGTGPRIRAAGCAGGRHARLRADRARAPRPRRIQGWWDTIPTRPARAGRPCRGQRSRPASSPPNRIRPGPHHTARPA